MDGTPERSAGPSDDRDKVAGEEVWMTGAARSIQVWSIYVLLAGAGFAVIPNVVLSLLGMEETDEVFIHILGILLVLLALYYWDAAGHESRNLFVASIMGRGFVAAALVVLWLTGESWQLLLFAAIDAAGAAWTAAALRSDASV